METSMRHRRPRSTPGRLWWCFKSIQTRAFLFFFFFFLFFFCPSESLYSSSVTHICPELMRGASGIDVRQSHVFIKGTFTGLMRWRGVIEVWASVKQHPTSNTATRRIPPSDRHSSTGHQACDFSPPSHIHHSSSLAPSAGPWWKSMFKRNQKSTVHAPRTFLSAFSLNSSPLFLSWEIRCDSMHVGQCVWSHNADVQLCIIALWYESLMAPPRHLSTYH